MNDRSQDRAASREQDRWRLMLGQSFHPSEWYERDWPEHEPEETLMWVYIRSDAGYTVGFWSPDKTWHSDSDWPTREQAASRVHFLNGGKEGL